MPGGGVPRGMLGTVNALQGRLGPGVLAHLLQYLAQHAAAGRLTVHADAAAVGPAGAPGVGQVYLGRGRVPHVDVDGAVGVPALARLLSWERGRFAFEVGVVSPAATVDLPVDRVLLSLSIEGDATADGRAVPGRNGVHAPTPLVDPGVVPGLTWAAVVVAGPIGEIFLAEAFEAIGHSPRLLPEDQLGVLVQEVAGHFKTAQGREDFLTRAEAVLAHHGYGRVEG
jgi:hypothetical protein